jgi:hypothetical protein
MLQTCSSASNDDEIIAHANTLINGHRVQANDSSLTRKERFDHREYIKDLCKIVRRLKIHSPDVEVDTRME